MTANMQDRVVVVAGASAGVGRAVTRAFARRGARLALLARGQAGLDAARSDALRLGAGAALALRTDIADDAQVEAAAIAAERELGPIQVWANVAMVSTFGHVSEVPAAEFRRVSEVNYLGYVHGTLAALRRMRPREAGTILQVGSALAFRGIPLQAAYCASKHAVQGFTESLRAELASEGSGVRVSIVHLPAINTPQFGWVRTRLPRHPRPVAPIFQPEVAAEAVMWAAEHRPAELFVGASTIGTRLANVVAPGLLDRYLARSAVDEQQTDEPVDHDAWRDNLDGPVDDRRDHGARGIFDEQAKERSLHLWATTHKAAVGVAAALLSVAAGRALRR